MTDQPRLIALTGAKGVGKSTYAKFLAGENGTVLSFATPIKHMLRLLVGHEYVFGDKKNEETHLGVTGRVLLQTLGTEWGRQTIDQDIWVKAMKRILTDAMFDEYHPIVIDDLRFENEAKMIREFNGEVWHIDRKNFTPSNDNHISEAGVKSFDRKFLL
jgi:nucleoside-triphosphatase THEP1